MKTIWSTFAMVLCMTYACNAQSLNDSLLIHYAFEGNAVDWSGNNHNGNGNAMLTTDRNGVPAAAYGFNGVNQYIDLPTHSSLKPQLPLSFSFFVSFDNFTAQDGTVLTTDFAQNTHSGAWVNISTTGHLAVNYGDANGGATSGSRRTKIGTSALVPNTWYHVAAVIRGPLDMDIYIDCHNDGGSYSGSGGTLGYTSNPGSLGRKDGDNNLPPYYFYGELDDFRYWNRALQFNEIEALCNEVFLNVSDHAPDQFEIAIYPNPAFSSINMVVSDDNVPSYVTLTNALGQVVHSSIFQKSLTVQDQSAGVYLISFFDRTMQPLAHRIVVIE